VERPLVVYLCVPFLGNMARTAGCLRVRLELEGRQTFNDGSTMSSCRSDYHRRHRIRRVLEPHSRSHR